MGLCRYLNLLNRHPHSTRRNRVCRIIAEGRRQDAEGCGGCVECRNNPDTPRCVSTSSWSTITYEEKRMQYKPRDVSVARGMVTHLSPNIASGFLYITRLREVWCYSLPSICFVPASNLEALEPFECNRGTLFLRVSHAYPDPSHY